MSWPKAKLFQIEIKEKVISCLYPSLFLLLLLYYVVLRYRTEPHRSFVRRRLCMDWFSVWMLTAS